MNDNTEKSEEWRVKSEKWKRRRLRRRRRKNLSEKTGAHARNWMATTFKSWIAHEKRRRLRQRLMVRLRSPTESEKWKMEKGWGEGWGEVFHNFSVHSVYSVRNILALSISHRSEDPAKCTAFAQLSVSNIVNTWLTIITLFEVCNFKSILRQIPFFDHLQAVYNCYSLPGASFPEAMV